MESEASITRMLTDLKTGDEAAAQEVWERFFHRVCGLARKKLSDNRERLADHEDVALSAINALCMGAREGRFKQLNNRDDLWQILAMITVRRTANVWRRQKSRPEGGESMLGVGGDVHGIDEILEGKEDGLLMSRIDEDCESLLAVLDDKLKQVALLRLQGYSHEEIASELNRSVKSIERYVALIRKKWSNEEA